MRKLSRDNLEVEKATVDKLEALEQSRRSSMQQFRRPSLVDVIPDWPTLQHREAKKEVDLNQYQCSLTLINKHHLDYCDYFTYQLLISVLVMSFFFILSLFCM